MVSLIEESCLVAGIRLESAGNHASSRGPRRKDPRGFGARREGGGGTRCCSRHLHFRSLQMRTRWLAMREKELPKRRIPKYPLEASERQKGEHLSLGAPVF